MSVIFVVHSFSWAYCMLLGNDLSEHVIVIFVEHSLSWAYTVIGKMISVILSQHLYNSFSCGYTWYWSRMECDKVKSKFL